MAVTERQPMAFMSYVRFDDEHNNGRLTELRERLSAEVRVQTGEEFPIFQDRIDIEWGQLWKKRIEESLDEITFFIPIITPSFFTSSPCRDELQRFLEREKELERNDLILPLYYVACPLLDDEEKRSGDELATAIAAHQRADWRDLRFEPFTSPEVGKTLARLAIQIRDALGRAPATAPATEKRPTLGTRGGSRGTAGSTAQRKASEKSPPSAQAAELAGEVGVASRRPAVKTEPPTLVVDPLHRGDHATITDAIEAANPGDRILVRPGLYEEGLVIDKPLEIIGEGDLDEVVVQAKGKNALYFKATMGRVANLTLRQMGGGDWFGVEIAQGRLELEGCDISSRSLACVAIHGGADPRLRRNRIRDGKQGGVMVYENSQGVLEDNDIFANAYAGVEVTGGSNPTLRRNRIRDNKQSGVFLQENGQGTLEDNDIFSNANSGVQIKTGANPALRRNRIRDNEQSGVFVYEQGRGILEENDIVGNGIAGVTVKEGGDPAPQAEQHQQERRTGRVRVRWRRWHL